MNESRKTQPMQQSSTEEHSSIPNIRIWVTYSYNSQKLSRRTIIGRNTVSNERGAQTI